MSRRSSLGLLVLGSIAWLVILACRTSDVIARENAPTPTRIQAPRPTFTTAPPTPVPTEVPSPAPTSTPAPVRPPTRAPAPRPAPTRTHTPAPPPPPAVPPTPNPDAGFYYRVTTNACTTGTDTRIVGTIYERGSPVDGVRVRVSGVPGGGPAVPDSITGVDPNDPKRLDDSLRGKYRLGLQEGGFVAGYFYVTVIRADGSPLSRTLTVQTDDKPGCNITTIDFAYP